MTAGPDRDDKAELRRRLDSLTAIDGVYPTRRDRQPAGIADVIAQGDLESARTMSYAIARNVVDDEIDLGDIGIDRVVEESGAPQDAAAFARAGMAFFTAGPDYAARPLSSRRAAGGNGAVTRVLAGRNTILLETQRLIVGFVDGVDEAAAAEVIRRFRLTEVRRFHYGHDARQVLTESEQAVDVARMLLEDHAVAYAEPDFIEHVGTRAVPDDPLVVSQWHHRVLGLASVWPSTTGAGMRIAIVDSGFDASHADLALDGAASGWFRPTPDMDDADFVPGLAEMPVRQHGTQCVGMAGAAANGAEGVGVAFGAAVGAVACMPDQVGTQATLARALAYAAQPASEDRAGPGANVIACSLGPSSAATWQMRRLLGDAIQFVASSVNDGRGVPLFWAVTNGNFPIAADEVCSHPDVIAVGRSTEADEDHGSGFGPELEFLAPGVNVLLPNAGGGYSATTGTSFACPCAAGVAALLLSQAPSLSAADVRALMRASCRKVGALSYVDGRNDRFGHGRVDPAAALVSLP